MFAEPAPDRGTDDGLVVGSVVDGRYRIDGILGSGGMGRVYRGEHVGIGRAVAIKVLHADLGSNREAVTRFQREALASGRLDHPNIVAVSDFGELPDGSAFLVMEALEGEPLGSRLARGRMPWREAVAVLRGVLAGLAHAHERGVVHRDVKPDNVFLARKDGELIVKVLDFGIAKLFAGAADDPATTRQGLTIGTPAYLSPEQAVGGEITPATDLYSATVVLFEMLTGRAPFEHDDPLQMLGAHAAGTPPTLREIAPDLELPIGMEALVGRGLAKRAVERVASALAYIDALDAMTAAPSPGEQLRRDSRPVFSAGSSPAIQPRATDPREDATVPARRDALERTPPPPASVLVIAPTLASDAHDATVRATPGALAANDPSRKRTRPLEAFSADAEVAGVAHLGAAPTLSLPTAARAVTLGDVASEPLPRSWKWIAGAILGGAAMFGLIGALVSHCGGSASRSPGDAAAIVAPPPEGAPVPRPTPAGSAASAGANAGVPHGAGAAAAALTPNVVPERGSGSSATAPVAELSPAEHEARYRAAIHQLEKSRDCAERRAAIPKLLDLGDARAAAPLLAARTRMIGRTNANACLAEQAAAAARMLGGK